MIDITDLRTTIVPKSDQLNAEQLLHGPITIRVSDIRVHNSPEQPVALHYEGDNGRPYKPCKTMRKLLVLCWGKDGSAWVGKSMTLYNDPAVKFGGAEVGGIRISHISDIERDLSVMLTTTKGKKAAYTVRRLESPASMPDAIVADWLAAIGSAAADELDGIKAQALAEATKVKDSAAFAKFSAAAKKRRQAVSANV